jgi:hypothetical protein
MDMNPSVVKINDRVAAGSVAYDVSIVVQGYIILILYLA